MVYNLRAMNEPSSTLLLSVSTGNVLKALRCLYTLDGRRLSQARLAQLIGVDRYIITWAEAGDARWLVGDVLARIVAALGVDPSDPDVQAAFLHLLSD